MKRPTQKDVAQLAGVSRATVSYVINGLADGQIPISEETRRAVIAAVKELSYEPDARAQALRSGNTKTIGLIIPDIHNPHYWDFVDGAEQEARTSGYHLLLSATTFNSKYAEDIFDGLAHRRIDGLILCGSFNIQSQKAQNALTQLLNRQLPLVEMRDNYNLESDCVVSDYGTPTREVMAYLLSLQHRRIGMVYGTDEPSLAQDRKVAYEECLINAGLTLDPNLFVQCGPSIEDGYQAALKLLGIQRRPTAVIAINDLLAIGVLRAASDLGLKIPEDLSLVGYDNILMSNYLVPRLTTVSKDAVLAGREAFKFVIERIQNPALSNRRREIPARLVIRESTGPNLGAIN